MEALRLLCDEMLGSLARWLRVLGFDTTYSRELSDREILDKARDEGRTIVTRDEQLAGRLPGQALLIRSVEIKEQIREFLARSSTPPDPARFLSRCVVCNTELVAGHPVPGDVPGPVLASGRATWFCARCKKYYWDGSHTANMRAFLATLVPSIDLERG